MIERTELYIHLSKLPIEDLREINIEIVRLMRYRQAMLTLNFNRGDCVSFLVNGRRVGGRVIKVNRKSVSVAVLNGPVYRVAPSLLTKEA
jgi:hypothetical protein